MPFLVRAKNFTPISAQPPSAPREFAPASDRRHEARCRADHRHVLSAQLVGGVDVKLKNVSTRGVMFESAMRVLVGARATLRLRSATETLILPGEVVRCRVSAIRHGRLRYETALALASDCPLTNDDLAVQTAKPATTVVEQPVAGTEVVEAQIIDAELVEAVTLVNEW